MLSILVSKALFLDIFRAKTALCSLQTLTMRAHSIRYNVDVAFFIYISVMRDYYTRFSYTLPIFVFFVVFFFFRLLFFFRILVYLVPSLLVAYSLKSVHFSYKMSCRLFSYFIFIPYTHSSTHTQTHFSHSTLSQ